MCVCVCVWFFASIIFEIFLLTDWVPRRKKEEAVNLKDLHKDIAKEQSGIQTNKPTHRRPGSSSSLQQANLRRSQSQNSVPVMDDDGFVQINRASIRKVSSKVEILQPEKEEGPSAQLGKSEMRRTQSQPTMTSSNKKAPLLSPDECGDKAKNMLKEDFVGGDPDDAVLTVHDLVQMGTAGDVDRGTKVVESSVFLVMEMKKQEATKCAVVLCRAFKEGKIPAESFKKGVF